MDSVAASLNLGAPSGLISVFGGPRTSQMFTIVDLQSLDSLGRAGPAGEQATAVTAKDAKWKQRHAEAKRRALSNPECHEVPPLDVDFRGVSSPRAIDLIETVWTVLCAQHGFLEASKFHVDVSQCITRRAWAKTIRTLTTSTSIFSFSAQRLLLPSEHLHILGFPAVSLQDLSPHAVRSLAGAAMAPPCVGVALVALILTLDTWSSSVVLNR